MSYWTVNPDTEEKIKEYFDDSTEVIEEKINKTYLSFKSWRENSFEMRAGLLNNLSNILKAKKEQLALLMAEEMGKPISQGIAQVEKSSLVCDYYSENAENQLKDIHIKTEMTKSYVTFKPLGVVLTIMPWNFPFWQVFRFAAPALMAGNGALLKHSPNTMGCAIEIENLFKEAGFPENLFTNLIISPYEVSTKTKMIIENPLVAAVTLTGSTRAGSAVAEIAGRMLKKTVLELGGSDPYIILKDADLEKAVQACTAGRLHNSGQSCIAAKRFIVHESIHDEFVEMLTKSMSEKKMGNPLDNDTVIGPLARKDLRDSLHKQVTASISLGAEVVLGCEIPDGKGYYYPASILTNVKKGMPAFDEELFGPVASVISFSSEDEAVELANNHDYGLGGAVFSEDFEKAERIACELIESGSAQVNDFVRSDPRLPFGGIKQSGYGRELSEFGIREFVNIKTVCVR